MAMIRYIMLVSCFVAATLSVAQPTRLIIRGDDMGFSHSGNVALMKCYTGGFMTSVEVIVPSPWFPEAVKLLQANPNLDAGIHLALTSEWDNVKWRPLTDCPGLRDASGYFYPKVFPNKDYPGQSILENKWTLAEVEKELRAQIEMAVKYIPRVSHVSGHMGVTGMSDDVKALTARLVKEYNLEIASDLMPARFEGTHKTYEEKARSFIAMLDKLEKGKTYVFVEHPGLDDAELRAIHHIAYEDVAADRQGVTDLFTNPKVKEEITKRGIQLISYKDIALRK